jgi:cytoskeletal protein CcmA (bactofilin family)
MNLRGETVDGEARSRTASPLGNGGLDQGNMAATEAGGMSVIGTDILVTGNIEAEVDLHIEGRVVGDVRCATLILGERSSVVGSIYAKRVRVSGSVEGAIETTDLAIEAAARVKGDVTYSRLRIANGGIVEGSMTHVPIQVDESATDSAKLKLVEAEPPKVHHIE